MEYHAVKGFWKLEYSYRPEVTYFPNWVFFATGCQCRLKCFDEKFFDAVVLEENWSTTSLIKSIYLAPPSHLPQAVDWLLPDPGGALNSFHFV